MKMNASLENETNSIIEKIRDNKTDYYIVMCCAGSKNGEQMRFNGNQIDFIADPENAPGNGLYYHPDQLVLGLDITWREKIKRMQNSNELLEANLLYKYPLYQSLKYAYNDNFFILSAGWGIIKNSYKIPKYDITFSQTRGELYKTRNIGENHIQFNDENHMEELIGDETIIFLGSPDYINQFFELTKGFKNDKIIFYKKQEVITMFPKIHDNITYKFLYFETNRRTNWYYDIANKLI